MNPKTEGTFETRSDLTCPSCGHVKEEEMPTDSCTYFYVA